MEKEIENFTHVIGADGDRLQISIMAEDITWANDYRRVAADVIEKQFPNNFTATDNGFGPLNLYISGTSAVSNGAQYVNVRLQVFSDTLFLPENIKGVSDFHLAKLGDPIRSMSGWLVFSEDGVLLPPIEQGMQFELWHQLNIEQVRKTITNVLSEFEANWKKVGKK